MPKIKIQEKEYEVNAEIVLEKKVSDYGAGGAHITMSKKFLGYDVLVVVLKKTSKKIGSWLGGYKKKYKNMKPVEFP